MRQLCVYSLILICSCINAQVNNSQTNSQVANGYDMNSNSLRKYHKVLIIPFDSKMYMSSVDRAIAKKTGLSYAQIRENMRYGMSEQLLLSVKNGLAAISLIHHDTGTVYSDLNYIYSSIGYKYRLIPVKEETEEEAVPVRKVDKLKNSITKLVKKDSESHSSSPKDYNRAGVYNGQIHTVSDNASRYMHTSVHNPNLFSVLREKYNTDLYLFINEIDIEEAKSGYKHGLSAADFYRRVKVHYTVLDQQGDELDAGAAIAYIPSFINDMNKIINGYLSKAAQEICSSLPAPVIPKQQIEKEKIEGKQAENQRKIIEKY